MKEHVDHFLFFTDNITNENAIFDESETRHMVNVLRLSEGDTVKVTNGQGALFTIELEVISKRNAIGKILKKEEIKKKQKVSLYIGIPEKDSFERLLPMVVPQGVDSIIPVVCEYCQKSWWDNKWEKVKERFLRVLTTSAKQCWNLSFPEITDPITFSEFMEQKRGGFYYADEHGMLSKELNDTEADIDCIIGPPGGFSPNEKMFLEENGTPVKLSDFRLRTELAGSLMISALYNGGIINYLEKK